MAAYRERIVARARALRAAMDVAAGGLGDADASRAAALFPGLLGGGALVAAGTRVGWDGGLVRARVDLWDRRENWPDRAAALWEPLAYRDGIRVVPAVIEATAAFSKGELGWWAGEVFRSLYDGNVWTPGTVDGGWERV